jgi:hypothetical protein
VDGEKKNNEKKNNEKKNNEKKNNEKKKSFFTFFFFFFFFTRVWAPAQIQSTDQRDWLPCGPLSTTFLLYRVDVCYIHAHDPILALI